MVVGFNHNFRYRGELYHIQTEDSGLRSPNIVTLLYHGGTILASKKTSYADITKIDNLDQVVEELMKEQHKEMLRTLKTGGFDAVIARFQLSRGVKSGGGSEAPGATPAAPQAVAATPLPRPPAAVATKAAALQAQPAAASEPANPTPAAADFALSLDEVILSYLVGDDHK